MAAKLLKFKRAFLMEAFWNQIIDSGAWKLCLFKNNHTVTDDSDSGDFDEANFSGYASQYIEYTTFSLDGSDRGASDADSITFSHNGGGTANTVYGWFIRDQDDNVFFADNFPAPRSMGASGDSIPFTVTSLLSILA